MTRSAAQKTCQSVNAQLTSVDAYSSEGTFLNSIMFALQLFFHFLTNCDRHNVEILRIRNTSASTAGPVDRGKAEDFPGKQEVN